MVAPLKPAAEQPTERAIPLTQAGPNWSQREYVACVQAGLGFAAHRANAMQDWWHYGFPGDIGCTSILMDPSGPRRYVDHDFKRAPEWIKACAAAVRKEAS